MTDIWFISDTHFGHKNILSFLNRDGSRLRPFDTIEQMHECIFDHWNQTVKSQDIFYHLGDFGFGTFGLAVLRDVLPKLPGKKRIILGNHDKYQSLEYCKVFKQVHGTKKMEKLWLSHVPIRSDSIAGRHVSGNCHGHLHSNITGDPGYFNVSCERVGFKPIHYETILKALEAGELH